MRISENACKAVPADIEQSPRCPHPTSVRSPFCREHTEEYYALEEQERTAAHEAGRLKPIVEDLVAEGVDAYTQSREIRKDERVVRLYLESLRQQVDAAVALKNRFFSEVEDRGSERRETVTVFLAALQDRGVALEREHKRDQEAATVDEPPIYPILEVPHPPCACTADSSDDQSHPRGDLASSCTAIKLRDGLRCQWGCVSGKRFCRIHCVAHGMVVVPLKVKEGLLETQRMMVAHGEGEKARRIADIKCYIDKLEEMTTSIEEHQRLFICRSPDSQAALVKDLRRRRTSAILLLAELSGRNDAKIAESQGQAETWAAEYLTEVRNKDASERQKAAEDLLTGAIVGGVSAWFGVPWARSAIAGVVTAVVVRKARDCDSAKES